MVEHGATLHLWGHDYALLHARITAKNKSVCQDSHAHKVIHNDGKTCLLVAVADGHGSRSCPRSHVGSDLAIKITFGYLEDKILTGSLQDCTRDASLKHELVQLWREAVEAHYQENSLNEQEQSGLKREHLAVLTHKNNETNTKEGIYMLYGTTLLAAAVSDHFAFFMQLGDGNLLRFTPETDVSQLFSTSRNLIGNETMSFAMRQAEEFVQARYVEEQELKSKPYPHAIQLTTDGYANSFATPAGFQQTVKDYLHLVNTAPLHDIQAQLPSWLQESSDLGSGDDISLVGLYRLTPSQTTAYKKYSIKNRYVNHNRRRHQLSGIQNRKTTRRRRARRSLLSKR